MSFRYDVFISYAHEDGGWAQRIADELQRKGLRVFIDTTNLRAGTLWNDELRAALDESQHLIVLASQAGSESRWVGIETSLFRARSRAEPQTASRIIPVNLDAEDELVRQFQAIDDIRRAGGYASGPEGLDPNVWAAVIRRLEADIRSADAARPIPVLVVTTTRDALEQVDPDAPIPLAQGGSVTLSALIQSLDIDRDALLASYGAARPQWRPFGSALEIHAILDQIKDRINGELAQAGMAPFRWDLLDEEFWSSSPDVSAQRLAHGPSLVVLDPVSLCDEAVRAKTNGYLIPRIRKNDSAVVIVLPPYAMPPIASALRESIRSLAWEFFHAYHNPPVFSGERHARYVTSVGDEVDLEAWLMNGLGPSLAAPLESRPGNVWTGL